MKTIYCISCDKILRKLFNNKNFAKCGVCQKITKSTSRFLFNPNIKPYLNNEYKRIFDEDIQNIFGDSILGNDSCIKSIFGNNDLSKSSK